MKVSNIRVLENNKNSFIIKFELKFMGKKTKNWMTIYEKEGGNQHFFSHVIYEYNKEKKKSLNFYWGDQNSKRTPNPKLYYSENNTKKLIDTIYNHEEFQVYFDKYSLIFDETILFENKHIKEREKYLKRIILTACEKDEWIGAVLPKRLGYVPYNAIVVGHHLKDDLQMFEECSDMYDMYSEKKFKQALNNDEMIMRASFIDVIVAPSGIEEDPKECIFAWELPEETLFYHEIEEDLRRLCREILETKEYINISHDIYDENEVPVVKEYPTSMFDEYYLMETITEPFDCEEWFMAIDDVQEKISKFMGIEREMY